MIIAIACGILLAVLVIVTAPIWLPLLVVGAGAFMLFSLVGLTLTLVKGPTPPPPRPSYSETLEQWHGAPGSPAAAAYAKGPAAYNEALREWERTHPRPCDPLTIPWGQKGCQ